MSIQAHTHLPVRRTSSQVVTPAVVGHRGASGYLPEHTLAAYRLAIAQGADDIELDLVVTGDGVLVARHEHDLARSTDVADQPHLAHRRTTKVVDGRPVTSWFVEDLTLAELRTLRARERMVDLRGTAHDDQLAVPTLDEVLRMVREESLARGRSIGVMIELKDAAYFESVGLPIEDPLLDDLRRHGLDHARSRVTVMSFESTVLRNLAPRVRVPLVQLIDRLDRRPADLVALDDPRTFGDLASPAGLVAVERYADGIGAHHGVVALDQGERVVPSRLVADAHREWLTVHVWTLRAENHFLPTPFRDGSNPAHLGDLPGYAGLLLEMGVDGLITDQPDLCLRARDGSPYLAGPVSAGTRIQAAT